MGAGYHGGFGSTNGAKKQGGTGTQAQRPKTVILLLDYLQGPIWKSDSRTGKPLTGINIIDNDVELPSLNFECCQLYSLRVMRIELTGKSYGIIKIRFYICSMR